MKHFLYFADRALAEGLPIKYHPRGSGIKVPQLNESALHRLLAFQGVIFADPDIFANVTPTKGFRSGKVSQKYSLLNSPVYYKHCVVVLVLSRIIISFCILESPRDEKLQRAGL